jgi:hypothetical protein
MFPHVKRSPCERRPGLCTRALPVKRLAEDLTAAKAHSRFGWNQTTPCEHPRFRLEPNFTASRGRKIVLAASTSESSEHMHSTWKQMLLATLPARYASVFNVD